MFIWKSWFWDTVNKKEVALSKHEISKTALQLDDNHSPFSTPKNMSCHTPPTKMDTRKDRIQLSPIISHKFPLPYFLRYVFLVRKTPPPNPFLPRVEELTCTWHDEQIFETPFLGGSPKCNQFVRRIFFGGGFPTISSVKIWFVIQLKQPKQSKNLLF